MFGWRKGWFWCKRSSIKTLEGLTYIGPCRCGHGPHAFYQDKIWKNNSRLVGLSLEYATRRRCKN